MEDQSNEPGTELPFPKVDWKQVSNIALVVALLLRS